MAGRGKVTAVNRPAAPAWQVSARHYFDLTKPRITWLILVTTGVGFFFGLNGPVDWLLLLHTMMGTAVIASGTAALNQWYEREADSRMRRTQNRPLPAGHLTPGRALGFGIALAAAGFLQLGFGVNWLSALLGLFTLASYLFVYTPLKSRSPHSTTVGAVPGAMPPLIGYAAARGMLTFESGILFAIMFLWQFPHFYAIAWMYREDYERAGIRMLPVVEPDGDSTARKILLTSIALVPVSILPAYLQMTGKYYYMGAILLGFYFLYASFMVMMEKTRPRARGVLLASVIYLPVLLLLMVLDHPSV
ncbi:MAG: protoheme IX farnesyltransferase [Acidobacteria bacterium]|nr:protoheme IX farnesyltransferase [Acidobacteriota bacterium]